MSGGIVAMKAEVGRTCLRLARRAVALSSHRQAHPAPRKVDDGIDHAGQPQWRRQHEGCYCSPDNAHRGYDPEQHPSTRRHNGSARSPQRLAAMPTSLRNRAPRPLRMPRRRLRRPKSSARHWTFQTLRRPRTSRRCRRLSGKPPC